MKVTQQFNCSQVDFDNAKSRDNISLTCKICNKIYYKNKKNILDKFKTRGTFPMFCSNACQGNFRTQSSTKEIKCTNCNKNFRKKWAFKITRRKEHANKQYKNYYFQVLHNIAISYNTTLLSY